jgi:hypothetical protein
MASKTQPQDATHPTTTQYQLGLSPSTNYYFYQEPFGIPKVKQFAVRLSEDIARITINSVTATGPVKTSLLPLNAGSGQGTSPRLFLGTIGIGKHLFATPDQFPDNNHHGFRQSHQLCAMPSQLYRLPTLPIICLGCPNGAKDFYRNTNRMHPISLCGKRSGHGNVL